MTLEKVSLHLQQALTSLKYYHLYHGSVAVDTGDIEKQIDKIWTNVIRLIEEDEE